MLERGGEGRGESLGSCINVLQAHLYGFALVSPGLDPIAPIGRHVHKACANRRRR